MDEFKPLLFGVRQPQPSTYLAVDLGPGTTVEVATAGDWPTVVIGNEVALLSLCPATQRFSPADVAVADRLVTAFTAYRAEIARLVSAGSPPAG
nr:hypothetical protein [Micromonospora sp. DSM 115978]